MTITVPQINVSVDTFGTLVNDVNIISGIITSNTVTVDTTVNGSLTNGNAFINGAATILNLYISANMYGGNPTSPATITIGSNVNAQVINATSISSPIITTANVTANTGNFTSLTTSGITVPNIVTGNINGDIITGNNVTATTATITSLTANIINVPSISTASIAANTGTITTLNSTSATIANLTVTTLNVPAVSTTNVIVNQLTANVATVTTGTVTTLTATSLTASTVDATGSITVPNAGANNEPVALGQLLNNSTSINTAQLSGYINNGSAKPTFSTPGWTLGWNYTNGDGEVDLFTSIGSGLAGGFNIYQVNANNLVSNTLFQLNGSGNLSIPGSVTANTLNISGSINITETGNTPAYLNWPNGSGVSEDPTTGDLVIRTYNGNAYFYSVFSNTGNFSVPGNAMVGGTLLSAGSTIPIGSAISVTGSFTTSYSNYGYVTGGDVGVISGNSGNVNVGIYCSNRIQCSELDATSDVRLKENIEEITDERALKFLRNIKPVEFDWKKEAGNNGHSSGYIAQEVFKNGFNHVLGVSTNLDLEELVDEDGFKSPGGTELSLNYSATIPYLHKCLEIAISEIAELKARIVTLESK